MMPPSKYIAYIPVLKKLNMSKLHPLFQVSKPQLTILPKSSHIDMVWVHKCDGVVPPTGDLLYILPTEIYYQLRYVDILCVF